VYWSQAGLVMLRLLGSSVLRRPSFEEKYRCSPAGSASSRSDSPSNAATATTAFYDPTSGQQTLDTNTTPDVQSLYRTSNNVSRDLYRTGGVQELTSVHSFARTSGVMDLSVSDLQSLSRPVGVIPDPDLLSTAGRPFVAVTSRTRSPVVVSSRPVGGPTRQFITSPPPLPSVIPSSAVLSHGNPTISSASPPPALVPGDAVARRGISGISAPGSVNPPAGFQIAAATALPLAQLGYATSPLDSQHDVMACDVTVTSLSSVVHCSAPVPMMSSSAVAAAACSSRPPTIVLQQVHSWEVAWPTAQKATAPVPARVTGELSVRIIHLSS